MQQKADSVITSYWGNSNLQKYIQPDKKLSLYCTDNRKREKRCYFNSRLTFMPDYGWYRYKVIHPAFRGDTAKIELYIDKKGALIWEAIGLVSIGDLDTVTTLTKEQAIQKVKELKNLSGIKMQGEWTVSLKFHRSRARDGDRVFVNDDPIKGNYTWDVKTELEQGYGGGCSYFNRRSYSIDIFSGKLVRIAEFGELPYPPNWSNSPF